MAIARENQKLAKRLFSHGSDYSKKKLDMDFEENIRLKKMLAKTNKKVPLAFTGRRNTALPPLEGQSGEKRKNITNHNQKRDNSPKNFTDEIGIQNRFGYAETSAPIQ